MRSSSRTEAEQAVQLEFRKSRLAGGALLALLVLLFRSELDRLPNRIEVGPRAVDVRFEPVDLAGGSSGPFRVAATWKLSVDDARFGGISALALDGDDFVALTDSGVAARFARPGQEMSQAWIREVPGGPGNAGFKYNRDSEALVADPLGRGWWVAFENRDELRLYDQRFERSLDSRRLSLGLPRNRGIEGMVAADTDLLLFPEQAGRAVASVAAVERPVRNVSGWLSDAVRLPGGTILVINRRPTPIGLRNDLVELLPDGGGYRAGATWRIPVGRLDNVEAIAAEPLAHGGARLWMMTDNGFRQRQPTLLIEAELRPRPSRR